ncbi:hypothetical protein ACIKP7_05585 [Pseudomonas caricapapayae]|jgi:hypothetical protein|uniref:Uncharacterized protein n=1 Tax=Pseudomonas caricapapayae TaxID=46678 RepID=A0ACC7LRN2_9PSED
MSLSNSQLSQLDRELDHNQREMVVIAMDDLNAQTATVGASTSTTQAPQICARTQANLLSGMWHGTQSLYNATIHPFVNTNWGVPAALGAYDTYNVAALLRDIGGLGTKARVSTHNGRQYLILTGYPGLRNKLRGTRYGLRNAQLVDLGIGKYGIRGSSIIGFKLSCYVAVGVEILEWIFNDEAVMTDLFAGVGVELIKAGIASAIGYAAALAAGVFFTAAAAPAIIGAVVVLAIGIGLNAIDNHYGIKNSVKAGMRYAVDHIENIQEKITKISANDLQNYAEEAVANIAAEIADELYNEAKSWVIRKVQPREFNLPNWPEAPKLPKLPGFNLPKF